jgi:anti-anti-sigma factor
MDINEIVDKNFPRGSPIHIDFLANASNIVVRLTGSLDLQSSSALQDMLSSIIAEMGLGVRLVVDLGSVPYIPSAGVGALTMALTNAKKRDITFQLYRIQPKVRAVFELLGFMSFFEEAVGDV